MWDSKQYSTANFARRPGAVTRGIITSSIRVPAAAAAAVACAAILLAAGTSRAQGRQAQPPRAPVVAPRDNRFHSSTGQALLPHLGREKPAVEPRRSRCYDTALVTRRQTVAKAPAASARRTKAEVQQAFESIRRETVAEREAAEPRVEEAAKNREADVRQAAEGVSVDQVVGEISSLGLHVSKALGELSSRLVGEVERLATLREAVAAMSTLCSCC